MGGREEVALQEGMMSKGDAAPLGAADPVSGQRLVLGLAGV